MVIHTINAKISHTKKFPYLFIVNNLYLLQIPVITVNKHSRIRKDLLGKKIYWSIDEISLASQKESL